MADTNNGNAMIGSSNGYAVINTVDVTKKGEKKQLLHPMQLDFPEGRVTAIFGPSGAGKTTLLDFITGSISGGVNSKGEVFLPGSKAYVPQNDALHGFYTCDGYMKHYTRLSGKKSGEENNAHIMSILESLGLAPHKDTIVGDVFLRGLSGGQKRRLSVALEALSNPQNFFLDEPTSGLDAESAFRVMRFLREYVRSAPGRRVILTIHQPSSFIWQLIDNAILLSNGKLMYQGPRSGMEPFFSSNGSPTPEEYNPADHYVTVVNDEFSSNEKDPNTWAEAFEEWRSTERTDGLKYRKKESSILSMEEGTQEKSDADGGVVEVIAKRRSSKQSSIVYRNSVVVTSRTNTFMAVLELTRRYLNNLMYNPGILGTRVAMYVMLSLLIGILFWDLGSKSSYSSIQSRIALLFYCAAFFIFMSVAVLPFTVVERAIVNKEVKNGYYNPIAYQIAQALASLPGTALIAFLTTLITVSMTGLREPGWYGLNMFLALNCAEALAQLVSHVVPHFIIGMALVAGMYGLFMLLQGFMLVPSDFPDWLRWSYSCAFHTYSWRTFMYKEFSGQTFPDAADAGFGSGEDILAIYEIEDVNPTNDMLVLIGYAAMIHLMSFVVLYAKYYMGKQNNATMVKRRAASVDADTDK